jgi:hypothetical protein
MTDTTASTTDEFEAQLTESVDGFRHLSVRVAGERLRVSVGST